MNDLIANFQSSTCPKERDNLYREIAATPDVQGIIASLVKQYRVDPEELEQLGQIALWKSATTFDPSRGTKFLTHLFNCVQNSFRQQWKREKRHKAVLISELDGHDFVSKAPAEPDLFDISLDVLDEREQLIVTRWMNGAEYAEVAADLNVSPQRIERILKACFERLRNNRTKLPNRGRQNLDAYVTSFSAREKMIYPLWRENRSFTDIAESLGLTFKQVDNAVQGMIRKSSKRR